MSDHATCTLVFVRPRLEKFLTALAALVLIQTIWFGVRLTALAPLASLRCERHTDTCTLVGADIFGTPWSTRFAISDVVSTGVAPLKNAEASWIVEQRSGRPFELGSPTGRSAQIAQYAANAAALTKFLSDPDRADFALDFISMGGPPGWVWAVIAGLLAWFLLTMIDGWRTTLSVDAYDLKLQRTPRLIPGRKAIVRSEVAGAEVRTGRIFVGYGVVPTLTFVLLDANGKVLFARRQTASKALAAELTSAVETIGAILHR